MAASTGMLFLDETRVRQFLYKAATELVGRIESAFGQYSKGKEGGIVQPVRSIVHVEDHNGFLGVMPGYSRHDQALACKVVSFYPDNKDIPTHGGVVVLLDATNGSVKAVMDGGAITDVRTAGASAVATEHLTKDGPKILAIVGSGIQARSHCMLFCQLFDLSEIRITSRTYDNAEKLASSLHVGPTVIVCANVEDAVKDADIIVTATFSTTPVLKAEWVKQGAHINAVGACRPDWQEIDPVLMNQSVVYTDSIAGAKEESGDILLAECEVYAEIGEIVNGTKQAFKDKTTVFISLGMAIEDVVAAKLAFEIYSTIIQRKESWGDNYLSNL